MSLKKRKRLDLSEKEIIINLYKKQKSYQDIADTINIKKINHTRGNRAV